METEKASGNEILQYRCLAGTLIYLGNSVLPQATLVVSLVQQKIADFRVSELIEANKTLGELRSLNAHIVYKTVKDIGDLRLCTFADAVHSTNRNYRQTGLIIGLCVWDLSKQKQLLYFLDWGSHKEKRICHSSYGAEILATEAAEDRGNYYKTASNALYLDADIKHELNVASKALWDTSTMLHEGREYRLRQSVQKLRNCFECKDLNIMRWIPGNNNIADALTKRNYVITKQLNTLCNTGTLDPVMCGGKEVDRDSW